MPSLCSTRTNGGIPIAERSFDRFVACIEQPQIAFHDAESAAVVVGASCHTSPSVGADPYVVHDFSGSDEMKEPFERRLGVYIGAVEVELFAIVASACGGRNIEEIFQIYRIRI